MNFRESLLRGQTGETKMAYWLRRAKERSILPVYDIPINTGKGPRFYSALSSGHDQLVAPDMLTIGCGKIQWVEAKLKSVFSWRRMPCQRYPYARWQTGIDKRHYHDYLHVREVTDIPLWIMFLHESSTPWEKDRKQGCPEMCPTGLFGREITQLEKLVDHEDSYEKASGREYPMVYWNHQDLIQLATLEEVLACQPVEQKQTEEYELDILELGLPSFSM